ncbi:MAG TPA: peroxiredoxin [Actinocatenispora sp.]
MATVRTGEPAPDFTLPGLVMADEEVRHAEYQLSAQRGAPLVLAFYPGDDTPTCTRQLCSYSSGLDELTGLGATVWAISPQDLDSHERFARRYGLRMPLLADADRTAVTAYGVGLPGLGLRRSVFVIDAEGVVRWKHVALVGVTYQTVRTISAQLAALDTARPR